MLKYLQHRHIIFIIIKQNIEQIEKRSNGYIQNAQQKEAIYRMELVVKLLQNSNMNVKNYFR